MHVRLGICVLDAVLTNKKKKHAQAPNASLQHLPTLTYFAIKKKHLASIPSPPSLEQYQPKQQSYQNQSRKKLASIALGTNLLQDIQANSRIKFPLVSFAAKLTFVSCKIWPVLQLTMCFLQWCECKCCWASMINWHQHKQQFPFASSAFS